MGAGTGALLGEIGAARPDVTCTAFEPYMALSAPGLRHVTALDVLQHHSVDVVSAFEVFEHLTPSRVDGCLAEVKRLLKPDGHFIVSVPIMEGIALPLKEGSRAILFRRSSDYSGAELIAGMFGRAVARTENPLVSHKGFSHRGLAARLASDFRLIERRFSPFPWLPWWMNSQVFLVLRHP
ncbi:class I SAM-dependent methyltransferase [Hyphomicrobiales bacterium BP6-180914]|uniref:Class I SAM-dependent methyltransferase n=1 Tax=Lichenifustis flavocetrariae TaxID=2949735 RepID=A0AA42CKA2_9HYPH|nr:class I SAM-dependent methyltransferase [Lichenifustis flavocetrariae]